MDLYKVFLFIHIVAGTIGLISGTINIIRKKGDRYHRLVGKAFLYGMLTVGISSFALAILHPNYFLFIIGVFTFYLVATGERYLFLQGLLHHQKPAIVDWVLTLFMLLFGIAFIYFGCLFLVKKQLFGTVFIVFGCAGLNFVRVDIKNYKGKIDNKNFWLLAHLQRMTGAYIAALTAFLVVNNTLLPDFIAWLLPTILVVPLITKWSKKYKPI